ncbi:MULTISPECIES: hypothetical protein [unclassified Nocardia]|uniref:hypothetical protein n=1 Tax=unclassified Nocardia TaxID=2637762 RepID=UPI001CE4A5BB|nr:MULTISPECIES: hypothetical protein [unclassified Nocardia]
MTTPNPEPTPVKSTIADTGGGKDVPVNDGDDQLSHIIDDIPIISGNGSADG